jgi:UDP:flavonoid glycosyltransferase YjiC (YdhE family)
MSKSKLNDPNHRAKAQTMQQLIQQSGGVKRAADIICTLTKKQP